MGYQYKFDIAGVEYGMSDVMSAKIHSPLFDKFSVGNACSAELTIAVCPKETIPKNAQITPFVQQEDGTWLQLSTFFVDSRAKAGPVLHLIAYDAMLKADTTWEPDETAEFPMTMPYAVALIASKMGVDLDERTALNGYTIDHPAGMYTAREVLQYIAGAHAGNWIITNEGKLLLVPIFKSVPEETSLLITPDGDYITFGEVRIIV